MAVYIDSICWSIFHVALQFCIVFFFFNYLNMGNVPLDQEQEGLFFTPYT